MCATLTHCAALPMDFDVDKTISRPMVIAITNSIEVFGVQSGYNTQVGKRCVGDCQRIMPRNNLRTLLASSRLNQRFKLQV